MSEKESQDNPTTPLRGTSSLPNPFSEGSPPEGPDASAGETTVVISAPDGTNREYLLTDEVREQYEAPYRLKLEEGRTVWYDLWWEGTEMVIEYEGYWRDNSVRPSDEDQSASSIMSSMMFTSTPTTKDGIPRARHPAKDGQPRTMKDMMSGKRKEKSLRFNVEEYTDDLEHLDEGVIPIYNQTRIDLQERADMHPLAVEDMFVRPWESGEGDTPINTSDSDTEMPNELYEMDFREFTDGKETLPKGSYGTRFHI